MFTFIADNSKTLLILTITALLLAVLFGFFAAILLMRARQNQTWYRERVAEHDELVRQKHGADMKVLEYQSTIERIERESAKKIEELHDTYYRIELKFKEVEDKQKSFFEESARCLRALGETSQMPADSDLLRRYSGLRTEFCNAAAYIISRKKGLAEPVCSVNIKNLRSENGKMHYYPADRSVATTHERIELDRRRADIAHKIDMGIVEENFIYRTILEPSEPDFYVSDDIEVEIRRAECDFKLEQPSKNVAAFLKSCLVVPVKGALTLSVHPSAIAAEWAAHMMRGNDHVVGFMCIDHPETKFFDRCYDLDIMREFAMRVFAFRQIYDSIVWLANRRT